MEDKNKINYKILGLILVAAIAFQTALYLELDIPDKFDPIDASYLLGIASCSIASFLVAKKNGGWKTRIFGRTHILLSIGFVSYFIAEVIYLYFEILREEPYPSPADPFYLGFYPLVLLHLTINIRFFRHKFRSFDKFLLIVISTLIVVSYSYITYDDEEFNSFDYLYGLIFVTAAAITLSFAVLGTIIFRSKILGPFWWMLALGLAISTAADVWYYYLEVVGEYDAQMHPVNTLWMVSFMVMVYALYKHVKSME